MLADSLRIPGFSVACCSLYVLVSFQGVLHTEVRCSLYVLECFQGVLCTVVHCSLWVLVCFQGVLWYAVVYMCWNVFRVYCVLWCTVIYGCWYVFRVVKKGSGAGLWSRWPLPQCLFTGTQLLEVLWVWGSSYCHYHYIKKQNINTKTKQKPGAT